MITASLQNMGKVATCNPPRALKASIYLCLCVVNDQMRSNIFANTNWVYNLYIKPLRHMVFIFFLRRTTTQNIKTIAICKCFLSVAQTRKVSCLQVSEHVSNMPTGMSPFFFFYDVPDTAGHGLGSDKNF